MDFFPLFLKLHDQPCLVVGAGDIAARKIELLSKADAKIVVVAQEIGDAVAAMRDSDQLTIRQKAFSSEDADGMRLVVAATNHKAANAEVANAANQRNIPVNVVDNPELSDLFRHSRRRSLNVGKKFIGFRKRQAHQIMDNHSYKSNGGCILHSDLS